MTGSARAVHHPLATLSSRLTPLIGPYLPFSSRQLLNIFAKVVPLFFSPSMLAPLFGLFDTTADLVG
jgi:hypothetical protein